MNNFIEIYDNVLTSDQCDNIIKHIDNSPNLQKGKTRGGVKLQLKDSWDVCSKFSDETEIDLTIYNALWECLTKYKIKNPEIEKIQHWGFEDDYNLQKYFPGGGYPHLHCEAGEKNTCHRVLVWMIYLNDVTDDGGTEFPQYNLTVNTVKGRVVLWPPSWTHHHKGVISQTQFKYIATGWFSFML